MRRKTKAFQTKKYFFIFLTLFFFLFTTHASKGAAAETDRLISLRGLEIEIGGELELEYVDSESNGRLVKDSKGKVTEENNPDPRMAIDKIVITPKVRFKTGIIFQADIEFNPDSSVKVDEAWIKIPGLPLNSWIKIGLEDLFIKPHRKTESYPLVGHAFWQDEDLGLQTGGAHQDFYWRFSVSNGRRLKDRRASEDNVFPITTDDDDNVEKNANKQLGIGLGLDHAFKEGHSIDLLPFYYRSELSDADIAYLGGISGYTGGANDTQTRYGVNLEYLLRGFTFFGQYIRAEDGTMDRDGWYAQPSYKQQIGKSRLQSLELFVRYGEYNVNLTKVPMDSRTWNRQTTTLAIFAEIVQGFKVKTEYYINDEETGGSELDNNELLVQLEIKF